MTDGSRLPSAAATPDAAPVAGDVRPLSATRRVVARKMSESARTIPSVTLHRSAPMAGLLARRRRLSDAGAAPVSVDAMLARAAAVTLGEFDLLNSVFDEAAFAVRVLPDRNVAVAVDTDRGLTAVVLRQADRHDEAALGRVLAELVTRAREGHSRIEDLSDATFTLTNLGGLGIDAFSPIIVPPQVAILGVGRFAATETRAPATLSLTFDHRVVDGAYAARFLARFVEHLDAPSDEPSSSPVDGVPDPAVQERSA